MPPLVRILPEHGDLGFRAGRLYQRAQISNRRRDPREVDVVAVQEVLIRIVEIVLADVSGASLMPQELGQLVAMEILQQPGQIVHEPCFSLHAMQTRVQGIAFSRASAIGSPQSRQMP